MIAWVIAIAFLAFMLGALGLAVYVLVRPDPAAERKGGVTGGQLVGILGAIALVVVVVMTVHNVQERNRASHDRTNERVACFTQHSVRDCIGG
jgi:hypothetical protein